MDAPGKIELSIIEKTRTPLDLTGQLAMTSLRPSIGPATISLKMQPQCHTNWCWAALASSVSAFYDQASQFAQCCIANLELMRNDCCDVPCHTDNVDFNQSHEPGSALNRVMCLEREVRNQIATRQEVQQEIGAGRPVCLRTVWTKGSGKGGAHALAIVGYSADQDMLSLEDPWFGPTHEISYDRFCTDYQGLGGHWTDTYFTQPPKSQGGVALGG
jgi:hypothetical protein